MPSVGPQVGCGRAAAAGLIPWNAPAGLKILVPGYAQWSWRQRERAAVLFGSFVMALGVGVFAWGTRTGLAVLAFALGTHVVSAVDVIRQGSFPGFGRWTPWISASSGLALGVYAPALGLASLLAWPVLEGGPSAEGYLVNCWAYRGHAARQGDWAWLRSSPWGPLRIGRVVAGPGQEVEWADNHLRVDGVPVWIGSPLHSSRPPREAAFTVPEGHVLVNPGAGEALPRVAGGLVVVPQHQLAGRAYARLYPLHDRRFLP